MRTNLNLDSDVHDFATIYAEAKGISLSRAVSELIRKVQTAPEAPPDIRQSPNGMPCFPPTGKTVTDELVRKIENEID